MKTLIVISMLAVASLSVSQAATQKEFKCSKGVDVVLVQNGDSSNGIDVTIRNRYSVVIAEKTQIIDSNIDDVSELGQNMTFLHLEGVDSSNTLEFHAGLIPNNSFFGGQKYRLETSVDLNGQRIATGCTTQK